MGKYNGILCEHCKKAFTNDDDIVVCPVCGAPHHRDCYNELGHCALKDSHSADFEWKPTYAENHAPADRQSDSVICPNCNSANLPGSRYCCMCQHPLDNAQNNRSDYGNYSYNNDYDRQTAREYEQSAFSINGVDSNELIAYTGEGFHYYIRQFKMIARSKYGLTWNWGALIFGGLYFLYRKMYKIAALLFAFHLLTILPTLLCFFGETDASMELMGGITVFYNSQLLQQISPFAFFFDHVGRILNISLALFANKFYLKNAIENITRYKENYSESRDTQEYYDGLYYLGKPSIIPVILVMGLLFLFYSYCGTLMTYTMN